MFNLIEEKLGNRSLTENGAVGFKTTHSALLDLNYQVSSLRNVDEDIIIELFDKAFEEGAKWADEHPSEQVYTKILFNKKY